MKRIGSIKIFAAAALLLCLAFIQSCQAAAQAQKRTVTFFNYFDTVITITAYGADKNEFDLAAAAADDAFSQYHRLFDIYNRYDSLTNIASVNQAAGQTVEVSSDIIALIEFGKQAYDVTDGAVNIAMGAVLRLWHDCRTAAQSDPAAASVPLEEELLAASAHCDISLVEADAQNNTVTLADPMMSLDVGAIAKGFACERVAELLRAYNGSYMLNCGGAVRTLSAKLDGTPWVAGIVDPLADDSQSYAARVAMMDSALSTSGSYIRYFTVDGVEYGHIIDPKTLQPARGHASVSVLCADATLADCLSTACFILSADEALQLIESIDGAEMLLIQNDGTIIKTEGFPLNQS